MKAIKVLSNFKGKLRLSGYGVDSVFLNEGDSKTFKDLSLFRKYEDSINGHKTGKRIEIIEEHSQESIQANVEKKIIVQEDLEEEKKIEDQVEIEEGSEEVSDNSKEELISEKIKEIKRLQKEYKKTSDANKRLALQQRIVAGKNELSELKK